MPADLGMALVELLAYVADYLSYQQDAVATEAYLGTARQRVSVRRHARLVDYFMHDGCNARAWVQVLRRQASTMRCCKQVTRTPNQAADTRSRGSLHSFTGSPAYEQALAARPQVFELMHDITLFEAHNEMRFYTWGARECCSAQRGHARDLTAAVIRNCTPGDVLIFTEVRGPQTASRKMPIRRIVMPCA